MKKTKSVLLKIFNTLLSTVLIASVISIIFWEFQLITLSAIVVAIVGLGAPVAVSGEGFTDILAGIFEAFIEGVVAIVEGIMDVISGIFS